MANDIAAQNFSAPLASAIKPLLILVGIAAAVAVGLSVALWSRGTSYSLLYANLAADDQARIAQALDAAQIRYRLQPTSNGIEVATEHLAEARLKLAGQGLPEGGGGFALLDKDPGFGVSQFVESARYQHALETELARTIANLRPIEGARVHIALPRQSAFVREQRAASASVFVQLKAGQRLEQQQVQAIINLVASSIPELDAHQVTVVDQQGRLLSQPPGHDEFSLREEQFDLVHRLEDDYRERIEALLAPLVGSGHVRAQVVAQLDMSVSEEAREQYRPDSQIVRSEQVSEQQSRDGAGAQGVPGALSNQPPPGGVAAPAPPAVPAAAKPAGSAPGAAAPPAPASVAPAPESSTRESTRNYEIDRTLAYTREPAGRLKRLTVAVLIDDPHEAAGQGGGKAQSAPLSSAQLEHITQLVKDAVGFDQARGDTVSVVNASFAAEAPVPEGPLQAPAIWERPLFHDLLRLVAGAVVLIVLVLAVLRPLMKNLLAALQRERLAAPAAAPAGSAALASPSAANAVVLLDPAQQLTQARTLVHQDPKRVAQVVRGWVEQDG